MKQESQEYAVKSVEIETKEVNRVIEIVKTAEFAQAVDILSKANKIVTSGSGGTGVAEMCRRDSNPNYSEVIIGAILVLSVGIDQINKRRRAKARA